MQAFRRYDEKSTGCFQFRLIGEGFQVFLASHIFLIFFLGLGQGAASGHLPFTKALYFVSIIALGRK